MAKNPQPDTPGADDPGVGRRLALDVGTARIGVAKSDRDARLATPVETIKRDSGFSGPDGSDIDRILELIDEYEIIEVIIGLPRQLSGGDSISIKHAKEIAFRIQRRLNKENKVLPVIHFSDERLTTVIAQKALLNSGVSTRNFKSIVDQAAAVEILQSWLDSRKNYLQ